MKYSLPSRPDLEEQLWESGYATIPCLLEPQECQSLRELYTGDHFRTTIDMKRHGYGQGEYKYFDYPLPSLVASLRREMYGVLAPLAQRWRQELGKTGSFPTDHESYLRHCHAAGQSRPTPLLLKYERGDFNHLHQDLYGSEVFPLQVVVLLSTPNDEFCGGEFVLTEQRVRMQSRVEVVPLERVDGVVFFVNERPLEGKRGPTRARMRHGVSRIRKGERMTLGLIFHDAT